MSRAELQPARVRLAWPEHWLELGLELAVSQPFLFELGLPHFSWARAHFPLRSPKPIIKKNITVLIKTHL